MIREASGCSTEEPIPIKNTEANIQYRLSENAKFIKPISVKLIPIGNDHATGYLSKMIPVIG